MTEFEKVKIVRQCCFSILPQLYCDRFSITEQMGKIVEALNVLIENNNKLEDYIKEVIQEVIESGEIEIIIKDILANYILNVKYPPNGIEPASGDGTKDDTLAIQGCIDYAFERGGMGVYFPSGSYLTNSLDLKNKVSLFGFSRENTTLVLKGGATRPLINGNIDDFSLVNLNLDGNGDFQVNNINTIDLFSKKGLINNVYVSDGYKLININISELLQMDNVVFGNCVTDGLFLTGNGIVQGKSLFFESISQLNPNSIVTLDTSNSNIELINKANINNPIVIHGNNNIVKAINKDGSASEYVDYGAGNTIIVNGRVAKINYSGLVELETGSLIENTTGNKTVHAINITEYISGNRSENSNNSKESVTGVKEIEADTIFLDPIKPLKYGEVKDGIGYKYIEMLDKNDKQYKLLATNNDNFNLLPFLDASQFGVVPNGQDMTATLNELLATYSEDFTIYLKKGIYTFNDRILVNNNGTNFKCDGRINSTADIAILVNAVDCNIAIKELYGNGNGIGFQNGNTDMLTSYGNSIFKLDFIVGFEVGLKYYANGNNGIQNNVAHLVRIDKCNKGIYFECGDTDTPWINQNTFHGGWIFAGDLLSSAVGIEFKKGLNMIDRFNGNVFNDFSCEGTRYPIKIEYAWHNIFNNFRMLENVGSSLIQCASDTEDNKFIGASTYINYQEITDNGIYNNYKTTFHDGLTFNVCNYAVFRSGGFIPMGEYFKKKNFIIDRGTALPLDAMVEYMFFDGSTYNVEVVLPIKYSFGATANSFILETGELVGFARVVLWGGQVIAKSEDSSGTSGVQLKSNMRYMFVPVSDITYKVIPITVSRVIGIIDNALVTGTASIVDDVATLNNDCSVEDRNVSVNIEY